MIKEEKMNEFTPKQQIILNNLSYGKENAISKRELMKLTGLDERSVRSNIAILRKSKNILICSNSQSKGYYFPKDAHEALEFVHETNGRIAELAKIAKKAKKWANKNLNQISMVVE